MIARKKDPGSTPMYGCKDSPGYRTTTFVARVKTVKYEPDVVPVSEGPDGGVNVSVVVSPKYSY